MGIDGFFEWVKKTVKYVPQPVQTNKTHTLIVDAKLAMCRAGYALPVFSEEGVANCLVNTFRGYAKVVFVNDGYDPAELMLKKPTLDKRKADGEKAVARSCEKKQKLTEETLGWTKTKLDSDDATLVDNCISIEEMQDLDQTLRNCRKISTEMSKRILSQIILVADEKFEVIQCTGEADPVIVHLAGEYSFVISEDSDLLVSGEVTNLIRNRDFPHQCLMYNSNDILQMAQVTAQQFKEMVCMSGCDYSTNFTKLNGVGIKTAHKIILKYKSLENFVNKMTSTERMKFQVADDYMERAAKVIAKF